MIRTISYTHMYVADYFGLSQRIARVFGDVPAESTKLLKYVTDLTGANDQLDDIMKKASTVGDTRKLKAADGVRDDALTALSYLAKAHAKRGDVASQEAGNLVLETIRNYGPKINYLPYDRQSVVLTNLVGDMENREAVQNAITTINGNLFFSDLKDAQAGFVDTQDGRAVVKSDQVDIKSEEACKAIRIAIEKLFMYLEVMQDSEPTDQMAEWINLINVVIDETMNAINMRLGHKTDDSTE